MSEKKPDVARAKIAERPEREHGERFARATVGRFFGRYDLSLERSQPRR